MKVSLGNELIFVERGQRVTSIRQLCDRWSWSNTKVKNFLSLLESDGMLTVKSDTKKTLITVVNYDFYQDVKNKKRHEKDTETSEERHESDTKHFQKHTNNNDNNELTMNNNDNTTPPDEKFKQDYSEIVTHLENCGFGVISPNTFEDIHYWLEQLNKEMVLEAINIADYNGKNFWNYPKGILRKWHKANLKSLTEVRAYEKKQNYTPSQEQDTQSDLEQKEWQKQHGKHLDEIMKGIDIDNVPF